MEETKPDPAKAREQLIERLERSFERFSADQGLLGTPESGVQKLHTLQTLIELLKRGTPQAGEPHPAVHEHPDTLTISWREYTALFSFYEDAIDAIQLARYSVRFQRPLTTEPAYPTESQVVLAMLTRLMHETK